MSSITQRRDQCKAMILSSTLESGVFSAERIQAHCRDLGHRWRQSFWSPATTLLTFALQILQAEKTLRAAVASLVSHLVTVDPGAPLPSCDPSAFAQARQRLPEAVIAAVFADVLAQLVATTPAAGSSASWGERRILLVDGSSVSMPDEPSLQTVFPQPAGQKPGCGFPTARLQAMFCWRTGAILDWQMDSLAVSEAALFRQMLPQLRAGDIVVGDRYYSSFVNIARLQALDVDTVVRIHASRAVDFRRGVRLGPDDQLVEWVRPERWKSSFGIPCDEFEALPERMTLRMIRCNQAPAGFRSRSIVIVTTILDPEEASADELLALYRDRWKAELNLRHVKTTLGMDILRGKSPQLVRKEVLMHLMLYNLLRLLMWKTARTTGIDPQRLSFAGTLHRLRRIAPSLLLGAADATAMRAQFEQMLSAVARDTIPLRPNRVEPRCRKRRPKPYPLLTSPRGNYPGRRLR